MNKIFQRNLGLIDEKEQQLLSQKTVGIAGTGTDGGIAAERLARAGIGNLLLADPDVFDYSNINRQFGSSIGNVGKNKAEVISNIITEINPDISVKLYRNGITVENVTEFCTKADIIVDEIDYYSLDISLLLHRKAREQGKYIYLAVNVGWGANLFIFAPDGMTLEQYLGLPENIGLQEAKEFIIPPNKFSPNIPSYVSPQLIDDIVNKRIDIPSVSPSAALVGALLSTSILLHLAKNKIYDIVPKFTGIDLYDGKSVIAVH